VYIYWYTGPDVHHAVICDRILTIIIANSYNRQQQPTALTPSLRQLQRPTKATKQALSVLSLSIGLLSVFSAVHYTATFAFRWLASVYVSVSWLTFLGHTVVIFYQFVSSR